MFSTISAVNDTLIVILSTGYVIIKSDNQLEYHKEQQYNYINNKYIVSNNKNIIDILTNRTIGTVNKRITNLIEYNNTIYITDRLGLVYKLEEGVPKVLFGSFSMITTIIITDKYIIISDKDSKIRISNNKYPYVIDRFIMIHSTPIVCSILCGNYIVSGGYDKYISLCNIDSNKIYLYYLDNESIIEYNNSINGIDTSRISNINNNECIVRKILYSNGYLVIIGKSTRVYKIDNIFTNGTIIPILTRVNINGNTIDINKYSDVVDGTIMNEDIILILSSGEVLRIEIAEENIGHITTIAKVEGYSKSDAIEIISKSE
ncbi:hypothetical protein NEOKW01_0704 [Nematocida sp. AWRm80]|nr:hypothetical protein NEOKW01_0704 [Nematocida sp. AWRm80]